MQLINTLNDTYKQIFRYPIAGYNAVEFTLIFKSNQYSWFMNFTWESYSLMHTRVCVSNNILSQFKNILPFGVAVYGPDNVDPFSRDAWMNGWKFYVLESTELETMS